MNWDLLGADAPPVTSAAAYSHTQRVDNYRSLRALDSDKELGVFEMWPGAKKRYTPNNCANDLLKPENGRQTAYDQTCIELRGDAMGVPPVTALSVHYTLHKRSYVYADTATYFNTLQSCWNPKEFLSLLKLHRSAGVELIPWYSPFKRGEDAYMYESATAQGMSLATLQKLLGNEAGARWKICPLPRSRIFREQEQPILDEYKRQLESATYGKGVMNISPFYMLSDPDKDRKGNRGNKWLGLMDAKKYRMLWATGNLPALFTDNPNAADWAAIERSAHVGFIDQPTIAQAFKEQILRFTDIIIAYSLFLTRNMLYAANLEDVDTMTRLIDYFASEAEDPAREILREEFVDFYNSNGTGFIEAKVPVSFGMMEMNFGTAEAPNWRRITSVLRDQYEAAMWLFIVNQNKYGGRINDLLNTTTVLKDINADRAARKLPPLTFQTDPWQNPFLVFDLEASKKINKPVYSNVAASNARYSTDRTSKEVPAGVPAGSQTSDFVSLPAMKEGMKPWVTFRSTNLTPLTFRTPAQMKGQKTTNAPWILLAAGAAAALYTLKG